MAVRSLRGIPVFIWIPPAYSPVYKIEIQNDSNTYDITNRAFDGEYTDGITDTIGNFTFTIENADELYTNTWELNDKINIYLDYNTEATTKKFTGIIEKISKRNNTIVLSGRSTAAKVTGITVTKSYTGQFTNQIILDLINSYAPGIITTNNIDTSGENDAIVTVNWYQKPFWECILDLCNRSQYDAYIDQDFDFNYFYSGTRKNETDMVVHSQNLLETGDFTPDLSQIKNRIIVYGAKIEDMQVLWVAEDLESINKYDLKEEIINDSNIITIEQAKTKAEYELSIRKEPPIVGEITSLMLPTLSAGEQIRISDPMNGLEPGFYHIQKFTHKFSNDEPPQTILTIQREMSTIPKILKKRIVFETQSPDMTNPYEMKYSWLFDFNTDIGVHNNTKISDGRLKATSSSGYWISPINSIDGNVVSCELRIKGDALVGTTYFISIDAGTNWQSIVPNTLKNLAPIGPNLRIKVQFASTTTEIDALSLLYKY